MELYKIVLLGNTGVGKSNLLSRMNSNQFSDEFMTTLGVEFLTKLMEVDGEKVKAQIWDTAGQERYANMLGTYYKKAKGAILVYDLSDRQSFDALDRWRTQLLQHADQNVVIMLVGNKYDTSNHVVPVEEAQQYADTHGMLHIITSAKTGYNVRQTFQDLITAVHLKYREINPPPYQNTVTLTDKQRSGPRKKCC